MKIIRFALRDSRFTTCIRFTLTVRRNVTRKNKNKNKVHSRRFRRTHETVIFNNSARTRREKRYFTITTYIGKLSNTNYMFI